MTECFQAHGLAANFIAPFSGELDKETVDKSLSFLPEYLKEIRGAWGSIGTTRASGLAPIFDGGPLGDAVRNGVWQPELQIRMPTVGGLPGSRGQRIAWPHG